MKKLNLPFGLLITFILSLVMFSIRATHFEDINWSEMPVSIISLLLSGLLCWLFHNLLMQYKQVFGFKPNSVMLGVLSILAVTFVIFTFDWSLSFVFPDAMQFQNVEGLRKFINIFIRSVVLSSLYYFICRHINMLKDKQEHRLEIEKLKQAQLEANISSLKEQLSPHFLFNTLNTLSTLTTEIEVKEYVAQLANVYRYVLENKTRNTVALNEELEFTRAYLHILQIRFDNALSVIIAIDEKLSQSVTAPFSLQLLVENAIKHNIASLSKPLTISIYNENENYIVVENNLRIKPAAASTGIGLANIMQRYKYLFQQELLIVKTESLFSVKLPIIKL